jgi:hypothetical protein
VRRSRAKAVNRNEWQRILEERERSEEMDD